MERPEAEWETGTGHSASAPQLRLQSCRMFSRVPDRGAGLGPVGTSAWGTDVGGTASTDTSESHP